MSSLVCKHCHLLRIDVILHFFLEYLSLLYCLSVLIDQRWINFMHCRSLRVRFILSIYFEVVWQQFGIISVLFKNPVNLNAFHCLLVVQLDTLCFFFIPNIVEVHELLLHLRCTITVNHLFKLKLGMILERATSHANLAHVVIILVIVRPLLVPQER